MIWRTLLLGLAALGAAAAALPEPASRGRLTPAPAVRDPRAQPLRIGLTTLADGGVAYRPASADERAPLLLVLHGGGGTASGMLNAFRELADKQGILLVAPQSRGRTWDVVIAGVRRGRTGQDSRFGADILRVDAALQAVLRRASVDRTRIVAAGFSDGAGYALSIGLANPQLFAGVLSLSPGFIIPPPRMPAKQRIFIAHGNVDRTLPFANSQRIAHALSSAGGQVRFREFSGAHVMNGDIVKEGMDFVLAR